MNFIPIISEREKKKSFFFLLFCIKFNYFLSCKNLILFNVSKYCRKVIVFLFFIFVRKFTSISHPAPQLKMPKNKNETELQKRTNSSKLFCKTSSSPSCFTDWKQLSKIIKGEKNRIKHIRISKNFNRFPVKRVNIRLIVLSSTPVVS